MIDPITQIILENDEYDKRGMNDAHAQIIKWFQQNPNPKDDDVHAYAEKIGMDPHELEGHVYMILSSILTEGYSKGKEIKSDPKELKMGIETEYEHTSSPLISRKIAMDHLSETPDYYTRLQRLEDEAEEYWKNKSKE